MPELNYRPTNKYLPPRDKAAHAETPALEPIAADGFLGWVDRLLSR